MNICAISGRLAAAPTLMADGRTIKFAVLTRYQFRRDSVREATALVPCVLFEATQSQRDAMLGKERERLRVELVGRVVRSRFENAEGVKVYSTEVAVDSGGLAIWRAK